MNATTTDRSPEALRDAMITAIAGLGYPLSGPVRAALRAVERHEFVPNAGLADAYASGIVVTKRGPRDEVLSCLSEPGIVALQLGQLDVRPGHRVLEIGAGTGYTAALLAHLAGPRGRVTTIDVDADIVAAARQHLAAGGFGTVEVVLGDGALGHPGGGPYDRIVAAVGAFGIPDAWLAQLAPGGRLVVPLRIVGGVSRSIAFQRDDGSGGWHSVDHQMCGFVPLRDGIADDPRHTIPLTADHAVTLHLNQEHTIDPAHLAGVLDHPRAEAWTGATFGPGESLEWLFLWLACTQAGLCRLAVEPRAVESGVVDPMFPASAIAVVGERELAYLTWRAADGARDRRERAEVGVIGHSAAGSGLTNHVAKAIRLWATTYGQHSVRFEIPPHRTDTTDATRGRFFLDRPHNPITVVWQQHRGQG